MAAPLNILGSALGSIVRKVILLALLPYVWFVLEPVQRPLREARALETTGLILPTVPYSLIRDWLEGGL